VVETIQEQFDRSTHISTKAYENQVSANIASREYALVIRVPGENYIRSLDYTPGEFNNPKRLLIPTSSTYGGQEFQGGPIDQEMKNIEDCFGQKQDDADYRKKLAAERMLRDMKWFETRKKKLIEQYGHGYVAIRDCSVFGHDADDNSLCDKIERKHGPMSFYLGNLDEPPQRPMDFVVGGAIEASE
jgi:hypothetical protein